MQVGESSDFWNNFETDIKLAQDIGMYCYPYHQPLVHFYQCNWSRIRTIIPYVQAATASEFP